MTGKKHQHCPDVDNNAVPKIEYLYMKKEKMEYSICFYLDFNFVEMKPVLNFTKFYSYA